MRASACITGAILLLALLASGCASTGAYPRDFFYEMHYQPSYRSQEPTRLSPAPDAVPITGRVVEPETSADAALLTNPVPMSPETLARASGLFLVNCSPCHGSSGRGSSPVATRFKNVGAVPPPDLAIPTVKALAPGQIYFVITNGFGNMPPVGKLLTPEERWTIVRFVRAVGGQYDP